MRLFLAFAASLLAFNVIAADKNPFGDCQGIEADPVRLACYDKLAKEAFPDKAVVIMDSDKNSPAMLPVVVQVTPPPSPVSTLSEMWELDPQSKAGAFQVRAHNPTYILPLYTSSAVNRLPSSPAANRSALTEGKERSGEVKFQISFKTKLAEGLFSERSDLWFGYTQQSHWQLYNGETSRDFRGSDYMPEVILSNRVDYDLFGWRGRFVNLGFLHQSNGRDNPLSRSWNRVYAQTGIERGDFALMVRPWWRLKEKDDRDDNPDIRKYMGDGDLIGLWKKDGHTVTTMLRKSFKEGGKGAGQVDWSFPLARNLKGYVQVFSGYGESLIDYNFKQTTLGVGVSLSESK